MTRTDPTALQAYIAGGYELIPLHRFDAVDRQGRPRGKSPLHAGWRTAQTSAEAVVSHCERGGNVGVRLARGQLVVDVDPRNFAVDADPLAELSREGLLDTAVAPHVCTGSGGHHFYFKIPEDVSVVDTLPSYPGVEFKAFGRQVVAAGSIHPNRQPYYWDELSLEVKFAPKLPVELLNLIRRPERKSASGAAGSLSPEELKYCLDQLPVEQYREHDVWLKIMMAAHHATAGEGRQEFLNWSTTDPQYANDAARIGRRWDSLHRSTPNGVTVGSLFQAVLVHGGELPQTDAAAAFDPVSASDPTKPPAPDLIEVMNELHCVVSEGGKFRIYTKTEDPVLRRSFYSRSGKEDFLHLHEHRRVETPNGATAKVAQVWLNSPRRRQYSGVIFDPERDYPGYLNLWTGWAIEPEAGDWGELKELLFEVLCAGDEASFNYVLNWTANLFQNPGRPAEVALVFRGEKGTGKGTYGRLLATLAGRHGLQVTNPSHLVGRFNHHLKDCVVVFGDEAFWAGDKTGESVLKGLVTEPTLFVEGKYRDGETVPNCVHLVMASNSDWVVPAGLTSERRFAVFQVTDGAMGDARRWQAIYDQLENGGQAAFLYDMLRRDIGHWRPRHGVPMTQALVEQKLQTLDRLGEWWYDRLCRGSIPKVAGDWALQEVELFADDLVSQLRDAFPGARQRVGLSAALGRRLKSMVPGLRKERIPVPDTRLDLESDCHGRASAYVLPPLAECRRAFEKLLGGQGEW